jgi:hypothetical protein
VASTEVMHTDLMLQEWQFVLKLASTTSAYNFPMGNMFGKYHTEP